MSPESTSAQSRRPRPSSGDVTRKQPSGAKGRTSKSAKSETGSRKGQALLLTKVGSTSVFRIVVLFYTFLLATFLVAGIILWLLLGASGYESKLNHLIDSLLGSSTYHLIGLEVLVVAVAVGVVWVVVSAALTTVAVKMFNLAIDMVGGIKIYLQSASPLDR